MDSPTPVAKTAQTESEPEPEIVQESPVFSFMSNFSPIAPINAATVTQGFSGLNSPPLVFGSPQLNRQTTFAIRDQSSGALSANASEQKTSSINDESEKSRSHPTTVLPVCKDKECDKKCPLIDQIEILTESCDRFVTDALNIESVDPYVSSDSTIKVLGNSNQPPDDIASLNEVVNHEHKVHTNASEIIVSGKTKQVEEIREEDDSPIFGRIVEAETEYTDSVSIDPFAVIESELPINPDLNNEVQNSMTKDLQHHGISRRCLQFEDSRLEIISNQLAQTPSDAGHSKSLVLLPPAVKNKGTHAEPIQNKGTHAEPIHPTLCASNVYCSVKIPKPQGIGLHLNSIVKTVRAGPGVTVNVNSSQRGNVSIRTKKCEHNIKSHPIDNSNSPSLTSMAKNVSTRTDENMSELHALETSTYADSVPNCINKASTSLIVVNVLEDQSTPGNKRKHDDQTDVAMAGSQPISKKKRNESSYAGDGCKRCNCKKSKCLKLYCDCFAAGLYCGESCACQNCYNKPEHDDIVLGTRQQIESRNPLAFAPRVVPHIIDQPDDGNLSTPSSARHKRGCNCKKSMCLKKYCECYQANVGCSDGCRCDGCKNAYGRKGAGKFVPSVHGSYKFELPDSHSLTPVTPAVQFVKNDASHEVFQNIVNLETTEDIMDLVSSDQRLYYDNALNVNELSATGNPPDLDWPSISKAQSFTGNSTSSLLWHGSPNTPMTQHSRHDFLQALDPDSELPSIIQDDTPEILKESPRPMNAVKVSSPNKKRISPPHNRPHESGLSISGGLRSGRKFILKAVPSFPPLTPCFDSKNATFARTEDSENPSGNK